MTDVTTGEAPWPDAAPAESPAGEVGAVPATEAGPAAPAPASIRPARRPPRQRRKAPAKAEPPAPPELIPVRPVELRALVPAVAPVPADAPAAGSADEPAPRRPGPLSGGAALAVLGYAVLRAAGVLVLWAFAERRDRSVWELLGSWDGVWYRTVVERGYDQVVPLAPDGTYATTNLAFFPLFPRLIGWLDPVLPGGVLAAQLTVAWAGGAAAAWGLYTVGAHLRGRRAGVLLALLFAVLPHAVVESMGYTESVFTAFAAWSLWAVLRRQWIAAGLLCSLAGLTRPTGAALAAAVGIAALVAACRRPRTWEAWVGGALAPVGLLAYADWVGDRLHRFDGYLVVQGDGWGMAFDGGGYWWDTLFQVLTEAMDLQMYVVSLVLLIGFGLFVLAIGERVPWPLLLYAALLLVMAVGGDAYYHAKARMLLPAFPLLLPVAYALAKARARTAVVTMAVLALFSSWYGAYLLLVWTHSP